MHAFKALICFGAASTLCLCTAEANPSALARRQSNEPTTALTISSTVTELALPSTSDNLSSTQEPSNSEPLSPTRAPTALSRSTADAGDVVSSVSSSTGSAPTRTDTMPSFTSAMNGPLQTPANMTSNAEEERPDTLPLLARITPALAVAGVILILAGVTYTLIGIKNRWIQIFLSSAFLTSLSVTVLLVYVMNPPVRSAVQGAYLVAVVMTGLTFGAGSLVFKEVTEGLGCLLGGFCLSMWLLALRPGGTNRSTEGRLVLIAAFTAVTYALSFSHYTRPYGLIGATSFAGATAMVLGLDCFSRAGLKEFWLYIWNLNDKLFPLNTNTYPITRGIRVELAVIILIFLLGVVSQLKLWKVIKDRREKKDAIRLKDERERNQMEATVGHRLEEGNERERAQWEAVYGEPDGGNASRPTDSGLGTEENNSLRKASVSVREVEGCNSSTDVIEMKKVGNASIEHPNSAPRLAVTSVRPLPEHASGPSPNVSQEPTLDPEAVLPFARYTAETLPDGTVVGVGGTRSAPDASESQRPGIIPLSFTVPSPVDAVRYPEGSSSTFSEMGPNFCADSKRLSGQAYLRTPFNEKEGRTSGCQSDEVFAIPSAMQSKGSSVAATFDDDLDELDFVGHGQEVPISSETKGSPNVILLPEVVLAPGYKTLEPQEGRQSHHIVSGSAIDPTPSTTDQSDPEEFQRPAQPISKPETVRPPSFKRYDSGIEVLKTSTHLRQSAPESQAEGSQMEVVTSQSNQRSSLDAVSNTESLTRGALDRVPSQLSYVVMSYRTNEWAKHISTASEPEVDEPEVIPEGADEELPMHLAEKSAPVNVEELRQTAFHVATLPTVPQLAISTTPSQRPADLNRAISGESNASNSNLVSGRASRDSVTRRDLLQVLSSQLKQGNMSATDLSRSASTSATLPPPLSTRGLRASSTPVLGQTLMTSPIDENEEAEFQPPARPSISPSSLSRPTLLAQRDSLLRNKQYSVAKGSIASPTETMYLQPPFRSTSRLSLIDEAGLRSTSRLSSCDGGELSPPLRSASRLSLQSVNDEDITLSQRKALIQQQGVTLLPASRFSGADNFDPHLPQRPPSVTSAQKRESMLASWRESMRQEVALNSVPRETVETRRAEMLIEKHQIKISQQHSDVTKIHQENAFDQAMRRGDMQELHKEAMRKMQANANRHV